MNLRIIIPASVHSIGKPHGPDVVIEQVQGGLYADDLFITVGEVKTRVNPRQFKLAAERIQTF